MAAITLGTLSGYWKAISDWVTGASASSPQVKVKGHATHIYYEGNVTVGDGTVDFDVDHIVFIANDSATGNLLVNFDAALAANGTGGTITIKPGEVLNDIPRTLTTLHVGASTGIVPMRALGVK